VEVGAPAADEVVVRVEAAPINPSDLGLLTGPADLASAKASGSPSAPADPMCSVCGGQTLAWAKASGLGHVHTFGIVHHISHPGFRGEAPYNVAVVELDEGPRINTHLVGCEADEIAVGMAVEVTFVATENGVVIPKFRPRPG
jgi:uncharacterized protein